LFALLLLLAAPGLPIFPGPDDDSQSNLAKHDCATGGSGGDIVVCARRDANAMRLQPAYAEKPVRTQASLPGGGKVNLHAEERVVGGVTAPAAMVSVTIPF
jgi:hypothetical protein